MRRKMSRKFIALTALFGFVVATTVSAVAPQAHALVGAHSYTDATHGDVFLGGDYIEVGISKYGSFGTDNSASSKPPGFYGTDAHNNIGMSSNAAGFGVSPDTSIDYFLPGTPEERWVVGYKESGVASKANNSLLMNKHEASGYSVVDQSSGSALKAEVNATLNSKLLTTQVISFNAGDKFFKNTVTLKNVGGGNLDSVRFMRSFDPDNTSDRGGDSATRNQILYTQAAGDGKSVVVADTSNNSSDPVFLVNGSHSPILFYSKDARAKVSTFGFSNNDPYASLAYDTAQPKGYSVDDDMAITITFDVGTLTAGQTATFSYYTSLDNRDIDDVLQDITNDEAPATGEADTDNDGISDTAEAAGPNNGDANGDGIQDSQQPNVTTMINPVVGGGAYQTIQSSGCGTLSSASVKPSSTYGTDGAYNYPLGMTDFTASCTGVGDSTTIKLFFDKTYDTSKWTARKVINGIFKTVPGAVFGTASVGGKNVTTLTYTVTDGGELDADGTANGTIIDPAGPAVLTGASAPNTGLMPESSLWPLVSLFGGAAILIYATRSTRFGKNH